MKLRNGATHFFSFQKMKNHKKFLLIETNHSIVVTISVFDSKTQILECAYNDGN